MFKEIKDLLPKQFKDYRVIKISSEASKRKYYRLVKGEKKIIFMDSSEESIQFNNFLKVYKILSNIEISIPKIYEFDMDKKSMILEDFGDLRFDKIFNQHNLKDLLFMAVKSLIKIKKTIILDPSYNLPIYNYKIFFNELSEFVDFFYPYYKKKIMSVELKEEFYDIWKSHFDLYTFNFKNFIHKDYNSNNLIYLPNNKSHFKCGILDFQDSFWGEDCWDLFSLLEDSRILFEDQYNEFFIKYYCAETNQKKLIKEFYYKYHFFNCSRQTRLLGRWIKLYKQFKQKNYLNFLKITNKRLIKSLQMPHMHKINKYYKKILPSIYA